MKNKKQLRAKIILVVIILFFIFLIRSIDFQSGLSEEREENQEELLKSQNPSLIIGEKIVQIEIAEKNSERIRGLSGRESLSSDEGMLFVFSILDKHSFWMKDMNFSIDIAWLDENFEIIYIEDEVLPESYPETFGPSVQSLYVLEVVSNFFKENEIKVGDVLVFENLSL